MKKFLIFIFVGIMSCVHAYKPEDVAEALNSNNMILKDLDLRGAKLVNEDLNSKTFISVDFRGANLSKTNFTSCYFIDCIFVDANIDDTLFQAAHFIGCNLYKLVGKSRTPANNFVPSFDAASERTLSGKEDVNLYYKNGDFYTRGSLTVAVSGLCRKIYDEAKKAQQKKD
jgi:hypothetical protein